MESFADSRLHFVNLAENIGEQSGPNNEGCRLARGRFIAFLNHDDLWMPDHLETLVRVIEEKQADLVYARGISILPDGTRRLLGAAPGGVYRPVAEVHASLWLFRRELLTEVGPWRHSRSCWAVPSQDWLIRAWRRGKKIVVSDRVTVFAVHASYYRDCYRESRSAVHETLWQRMSDEPDFRETEISAAALAALEREKSLRFAPHLAALGARLVLPAASGPGNTADPDQIPVAFMAPGRLHRPNPPPSRPCRQEPEKKMTVLVTGAAGFIGSNLVDALLAAATKSSALTTSIPITIRPQAEEPGCRPQEPEIPVGGGGYPRWPPSSELSFETGIPRGRSSGRRGQQPAVVAIRIGRTLFPVNVRRHRVPARRLHRSFRPVFRLCFYRKCL